MVNRIDCIALALVCSWGGVACSAAESTRGGHLQVTVSAESLGANGYAFPPVSGQEVAFVDGWEIHFERIIVAIDHIRISIMPDRDPGNQGVFGSDQLVRQGPWIVDLTRPGDAEDKGGAGRVAVTLPIDDLKDRFELEQRYAFSYDLVPANGSAQFVNVAATDPDVSQMIEAGERALLIGHAQFKGQGCQASVADYPFESLPNQIDFRFGLDGAVSYLNCQNPDNQGAAIEGEESPRGIQVLPHGTTTAQITLHTDHLFWSTVRHENLPQFNQFAANAQFANGVAYVDLAAMNTVKVPALTDSAHRAIPWRSCIEPQSYVLPKQPPTMTFDPASQPLTNLGDFVAFNAAAMGHLNADGLCYVQMRN